MSVFSAFSVPLAHRGAFCENVFSASSFCLIFPVCPTCVRTSIHPSILPSFPLLPHSPKAVCLFYYCFLPPLLSLLLPLCACVFKQARACVFVCAQQGSEGQGGWENRRCVCLFACVRARARLSVGGWGCLVMHGWCRWHRRHRPLFTHTQTLTHTHTLSQK